MDCILTLRKIEPIFSYIQLTEIRVGVSKKKLNIPLLQLVCMRKMDQQKQRKPNRFSKRPLTGVQAGNN